MTHIPTKLLLAPRPGTIHRQLKNLADRHWTVRMMMFLADEIYHFHIGTLHVTVQTQAAVYPATIRRLLRLHQRGDWGDVSASQRRFNDAAFAVGHGTLHSLFSAEEKEVHLLTFDCCCRSRRLRRRTLVCLKSELHHRPCECVWADCPVELGPSNDSLFPPLVLEALKNMLAYLWAEELPNYDISTKEERSRHILNSVAAVNDWLEKRRAPTDLDALVAEIAADLY